MPKAKKRSPQTLMTKEQIKLIIHSSICDENEKLKEVLSQFKGRIEMKDLAKIEAIDQEIYKIFRTKDAIKEIIDKTSIEWRQKQYMGEVKEPCQLCGSTKSEKKYIIVNMINNNQLLVGSSCIYKFDKMDNKLHGISITKVARLSKHDPQKLQRMIEFNELYGFGEDIFEKWKNEYNNFDIIFPKMYEDNFQNILKLGRKIYRSYIDGKINDVDIKKFQTCVHDYNYLYNKCMNYYENKKDDQYALNKKIAKFLEDRGLITTLSHIQEKGKITKDFAKHVYHIEFVQRFRKEIENEFSKFNIVLKDIDEQYIEFTYKHKSYQPIELYSTLENFVHKFSDIFYNINNFTKDNVINGLKISNSFISVERFIDILENVLNKKGYYFKIDVNLYEKQQIEIYKKGSKTFSILDLSYILDEYKECLYLDGTEAKNILLSKIETINNWIDKSDKDKYNIGNIAEKWAK